MASVFLHVARAIKEFGVRGTIAKMYMQGEVKFGTLIGMDKMGNKYFENLEYPFGQHRWVEFKDIHNFEPAMIPPEWHGWMHHTYDEPPEDALSKPDFHKTVESSHTPYDHHHGHISEDFVQDDVHNPSQKRARGYGVGNAPLYMDPSEEDKYWKQPSHPLNVLDAQEKLDKKGK